GGDRTIERALNGAALGGAGDHAEEVSAVGDRGDRERQGVGGDGGEGGEAAVVDLLLAAGVVERDDLGDLRVVEIGDGGVVEGDVAVLADAQAHDVDGGLAEQVGVAAAFGVGGRGAVDQVHRAGLYRIE